MRKTLIISVVGIGLLGTVAAYMIFKSPEEEMKNSTPEALPEKQEVAEVEKPIIGTGSMQELLARGENLECSIKYTSADSVPVVTEGTYFTSMSRMRGDFVVSGMDKNTVSSVILRDDTFYSWTEIEGEKYGLKISLSDLEASKKSETAPQANESVPLDAPVSYDCKPWVTLDGSIFEPPTDVLFKDYADLMNTGMEYGNVYDEGVSIQGNSPCALCDQVKGDGNAECKKQFSCE